MRVICDEGYIEYIAAESEDALRGIPREEAEAAVYEAGLCAEKHMAIYGLPLSALRVASEGRVGFRVEG